MDWLTTSTILEGLGDFGNQTAWQRLTNRFRLPLFRFAQRMGLPDADAEDASQEALLAFAESFRSGHYDAAKGKLSQWLFGIAYRQVLNQRRRAAQQVARVGPPADDTDWWNNWPDDATATQMWEDDWERAVYEQCLDQVRQEVEATTYQAFELVMRLEGSAAEAAQVLGVPVKTVYNAKHRVLKRIRELRTEFENTCG